MNSKHFVSFFLSSVVFLFLMISTVNFIVDPGEIYLKKILADIKAKEFSKKLFNSKNGIVQTGWNERFIKTTLAKEAEQFDCIILGSSHIMGISIVNETANISARCKSLLNLGVSGGSIEDIAIFSFIILNDFNFPKKIFIGIDPWTLKFNMDSRFGAYRDYYNSMNGLLRENHNQNSYLLKLMKNLLNEEYFLSSLEHIFNKKNNSNFQELFKQQVLYPSSSFNYDTGYIEQVTLQDGSHVYASNWIQEQKINMRQPLLGQGDYKITGNVYDINAIEYLKKIIRLYHSKNIEINFIMTPYHPDIFKIQSTTVMHISEVEKVVRHLSSELKINLYGSFFPDKLGCKNDEFYDFMHATKACLDKISF